eukprot:scaffold19196_cov19-Tisochrysis_lutea.AAC.1
MRQGPAQVPGRDGRGSGLQRRTAMVTCSTSPVPVSFPSSHTPSCKDSLCQRELVRSGIVDMHSIESTIQRLIGSGLDPKLENNPYLCFVYTSFQ